MVMDLQKSHDKILSPSFAASLSICYTLIYVIPFYIFSSTRPSALQSRDTPYVVRARIRSVIFSSLLICIITTVLCSYYGDFTASEIIRRFGWWPVHLTDVIKCCMLVAILFVGPLFERTVIDGRWRLWLDGSAFADTFSSIMGWRTLIFGPVSEELVWRSMIVTIHLLAQVSPTRIVFVTPLYFGIAHVHHCYEFKLLNPKAPLLVAILRSLFQFTYTSLFGFFAAFVFMRTGNLPAATAAHTLCNWMGLPQFWGRIQSEQGGRIHIFWTLAYYCLLLLGAYGFYVNLFYLTESRNTLVPGWPK